MLKKLLNFSSKISYPQAYSLQSLYTDIIEMPVRDIGTGSPAANRGNKWKKGIQGIKGSKGYR